MANYRQMQFICDCGKRDSKLIPTSSIYDTDEYPRCCDKTMAPLHVSQSQQLHYVIGDITPYKSVIDGDIISSRSHHRAHMSKHGVIEVGNEKMDHIKPPGYQKGDLRERLKYNLRK